MSERVTWLMSVRNSMPFLRETLESIAAQTYTNYEMLAWDDSSTDGTFEELSSWVPSRIPGRVFSGSSFRLGANLAFLVQQANTELCARIDGDDVNLPSRLERQVAHMLTHPEVVALGSQVTLIDSKGKPTGERWACPRDDAEARWRTRWQAPISHPATLFRKSAVLRAGNYADIESEDSELWIRLSKLGEIYSLPDILLLYRRHGGSITANCTDFFAHQLGCARHAASHLFPGIPPEEALALWRLTHPQRIGEETGPIHAKDILQLSRAAVQLARACGKLDNYFKNGDTYRTQAYWLRRNFLHRYGLLKLADALTNFSGRTAARASQPSPEPTPAGVL